MGELTVSISFFLLLGGGEGKGYKESPKAKLASLSLTALSKSHHLSLLLAWQLSGMSTVHIYWVATSK